MTIGRAADPEFRGGAGNGGPDQAVTLLGLSVPKSMEGKVFPIRQNGLRLFRLMERCSWSFLQFTKQPAVPADIEFSGGNAVRNGGFLKAQYLRPVRSLTAF